MAELTIVMSSHNFVVTNITPRARAAIETFARKYVLYGIVKTSYNSPFSRVALKVFAASTADRCEFRFHINQLEEFKRHLEYHYLTGDLVAEVQKPVPVPIKVTFDVKSEWKDRDYQIPVIEYLVSHNPPVLKFVNLATGLGKSFCSMRAMQILGERTCIIVKPMYIEKWVLDMRRTYDIAFEDILVIRGSDQLQELLLEAETGELETKVIIISNKTFQNWIKLYEKFREETLDMGYACLPENYCQHLGVGIRLIDEVHQDFHLNFKIDLYTNVPHSISLSATLVSDDAFLNNMYEIAYPAAYRCRGPAYKKYIASMAVIYKVKNPDKIRTKEYNSHSYTHHQFEQSILKNFDLTKHYFELVYQTLEGTYKQNYKKGDKAIVYCKSIDMCTLLTNFLKDKYKHLDIRRYVEEDVFENLLQADISVTTLESAGTAVDIDQLTTVILTTAVTSSQANIQGFGRLRELKDGRTPTFAYFVCEDIAKHIEYHERKRVLLEDRALTYKSVFISNVL